MRNKFLVGAGLALAIVVAIFLYDKYRIAPKVKFDSLLLTDLDGNPVSLDTFQDKNLFINFFATWCGPCMSEMPALAEAQWNLDRERFQFLLISEEPIDRLQSFQRQTGNHLLILHSKKALNEYRIFTLPTSYVLNTKREIVFTKVGIIDWANSSMIEKLGALAGQ